VNTAIYVRVAAIYLPLIAATLAGLLRPQRSRQLAACLLSLLWTLCTLLVLQRFNQLTGWWTFSHGDLLFREVPLTLLWLGCALGTRATARLPQMAPRLGFHTHGCVRPHSNAAL